MLNNKDIWMDGEEVVRRLEIRTNKEVAAEEPIIEQVIETEKKKARAPKKAT